MRITATIAAALALGLAAPAAAQQQPGPEATVDIAATSPARRNGPSSGKAR